MHLTSLDKAHSTFGEIQVMPAELNQVEYVLDRDKQLPHDVLVTTDEGDMLKKMKGVYKTNYGTYLLVLPAIGEEIPCVVTHYSIHDDKCHVIASLRLYQVSGNPYSILTHFDIDSQLNVYLASIIFVSNTIGDVSVVGDKGKLRLKPEYVYTSKVPPSIPKEETSNEK